MSDAFDRCYAQALRLLGFRFRGERELLQRLERKGHESEVVADVLARLRTEGWLDDKRFAATLVRSRAKKGQSRRRIEGELSQLGVEAESRTEAMGEHYDETAVLSTAIEKKIRMLDRRFGPDWMQDGEQRKKLIASLCSQGYDYGKVAAAVEERIGKKET